MSQPQQDGATKREHLRSIERQTGKPIEALHEYQVPVAGTWIMYVFNSVRLSRSYQSGKPQPISNLELQSWCQLHDVELTPFEVNTLKELDITFLNTWYKLNRSD